MADMFGIPLRIAPVAFSNLTGAPAFASFTVDSSTDGIGVVFRAAEAATITHLGFRYALRTGTPVQHKIGLQGVDVTNGRPDGTYLGGGSPASGTFTPPADATWDGTFQWVALDNSYACTKGELLGFVVEPNGTTPDGANNSAFTTSISNCGGAFPFGRTRNSGSYNSTSYQTPVFGYQSSTKSYGLPVQAISTYAISTSTTPDEVAATFTIPAGACSSYVARAARVVVAQGGAGDDFDIKLYQGTTELDTQFVDGSYRPGNSGGSAGTVFDDGDSLAAGTEYSIAITPTTTTAVDVHYFEFASQQDAEACAGGSLVGCQTRVDAGAWSAVTTRRLLVELELESMTATGGTTIIQSRQATLLRQ